MRACGLRVQISRRCLWCVRSLRTVWHARPTIISCAYGACPVCGKSRRTPYRCLQRHLALRAPPRPLSSFHICCVHAASIAHALTQACTGRAPWPACSRRSNRAHGCTSAGLRQTAAKLLPSCKKRHPASALAAWHHTTCHPLGAPSAHAAARFCSDVLLFCPLLPATPCLLAPIIQQT